MSDPCQDLLKDVPEEEVPKVQPKLLPPQVGDPVLVPFMVTATWTGSNQLRAQRVAYVIDGIPVYDVVVMPIEDCKRNG